MEIIAVIAHMVEQVRRDSSFMGDTWRRHSRT